MNPPQNALLHAIFKGKVQKVGFRWTIVDAAERFALVGTVKNLSDGSVEVFAEGPLNRLESFLEAIKKDPGNAQIDTIDIKFKPITNKFKIFSIT